MAVLRWYQPIDMLYVMRCAERLVASTGSTERTDDRPLDSHAARGMHGGLQLKQQAIVVLLACQAKNMACAPTRAAGSSAQQRLSVKRAPRRVNQVDVWWRCWHADCTRRRWECCGSTAWCRVCVVCPQQGDWIRQVGESASRTLSR